MKARTTHWNPVGPTFDGVTRCGLDLKRVNWREDPADATCNNCIRCYQKDVAVKLDA